MRRSVRGATLVELAVASFLFLIVLGLTSKALTAGVKNYLSVRSEIELQQDAIVILSRMAREVGEAESGATWPTPVPDTELLPPGTEPQGIVFSSPRNGNGELILDTATRRPTWFKRICYIYDPATRQILRSEDPLATPSASPPNLDPTKTTGWFQTNRPQDPFPGRVEDFHINVGPETDSFAFDLKVSTSSLGRTTSVQFLGHSTMRGN